MTHSTVLKRPCLGLDLSLLFLLDQSLSPLTNLAILLYFGPLLSGLNIRTLVLGWKQETAFVLPCLAPRTRCLDVKDVYQ